MSACVVQATLMVCSSSVIAAQEQPEEVVVTGSRIRQNPVDRFAPLQTATAADIDRSGEISVADYLQRLPISGSAINRSNNSSGNLGFPPDGGGIGAGASEIDLRYLGSKRVLVLVDGKRWVRGSSASGVSGAVDLNTVPTAAIDRIEVLQDGASPIYGSDAIGGVVNIITRSDYTGFDLETNQAAFDEGDGYTQDYSLAFGAGAERSRAFFAASYSRQDAVYSKDRDLSREVIYGAPPGIGGSSGTPQGRFIFLDPRGDVNGDGNPDVISITLDNGVLNDGTTLPIYDPNNPTGGDFHAFATADRFNFRPFNYLVTPSRRVNLFGKAEYDVSDDVVFRFTAAYTNRKSSNQAAPNPLFLGSDAGAGFYLDNIFIPANQRYNPFGIDLDGRSNLITLGRRPLEAGPRIFDQTVDTWMMSGTLSGELQLADRPMFWDVSVNWGRNNASQQGRNIFNARKLALALGPEANCLAVPGCVPFNIFGGQGPNGTGSITQDMLDWATFIQNDQSEQELNDIIANISGDLFKLPAGSFAYALGLEYRKETGSFTPDATVQAGETADVPAAPTAGSTRVREAYLELRAPVLADLPAVKRLELSAAVRSSDYDRIGRDEVFKGGVYWRVVDDLALRASYAEGFRAPNIGELFNSGSRFDSNINDPCSNFTGNASATIRANCASLGVPTSFVQINQQISVQTGGNEALQPETSETLNVGFAYNPSWAEAASWIEQLTFDVNYYDIKLENAIQALSAQIQLTNCVNTLSPLFCSGIVRGPGGSITAFANQLTNIGRIETDGFDWTVLLATPEASWGSLRFQWSNTYLAGYKEFTLGASGLVATERAGIEVGSPTRGFVRFKSTLAADWLFHDFVTSITLRYFSKLTEICPGALVDNGLQSICSDPVRLRNQLDSKVYTDLQLSWTPPIFDQQLQLAVGVNNALDEDPPPCLSCDLNNYDGTLYPVPGRFFHARAALKF
ncbi:TonB-dependent receptor plug domain-containing protein [Steroidobacter sp.]|uniref:TonB-dependent receptor plug domain-containing protein n=1 Tax=Steroidobacter sp. TaxID=1978227 RepID=UPI001A5136B9|nr:TonB-dependent receptor [Steroidobacter sp.]MBL8270153.1 TonB-dependent receptor [Steroidobacter sp.]